MRQMASLEALLLVISAASAQSAGDKPAAGGQISPAQSSPGGATIPPEQRSNATRDIPMGNNKAKASGTAGSIPDKRAK